jgi:hypothetical protein
MKDGKVFAIAGIALAVGVGLFLLLKPKTAIGQPVGPVGPVEPVGPEPCPDKPTFVKCANWDVSKKCYNPLLVNPATGLNPNGSNPCAEPEPAGYDYGYDYESGEPNWMPEK